MPQTNRSLLAVLLASGLLAGCTNAISDLQNINKPPPLAPIANPQEKPDYQPLSWPMPETQPAPRQYANSLWQPGARAFFRDQRAARVGDILRVNVKINDKAQVNNETEGKRDSSESVAVPSALGLQERLVKWLPGEAEPANLLDITGSTNSKGKGTIKRQETITTQVAALITQVLPNGNLVIDGKQEININNEVREVSVKGVVRPQDISSDNTVESTQIAEARIIYGGRGQLTNVQRQRWGGQVIDILSPF